LFCVQNAIFAEIFCENILKIITSVTPDTNGIHPNGGGADPDVPDDGGEDLGRVDVADAQSADARPAAEDVEGHDRPLVRVLAPENKYWHEARTKSYDFLIIYSYNASVVGTYLVG
jgi:hypothetical protein